MSNDLPTLIISRMARQIGSDWHNARSWFGGQPQLGARPWPRGGVDQTPFYFLAQIDLGEVGREIERCGISNPFPDGALAFFIHSPEDELRGAVVHVPRSDLGEPTPPPPDALAVLEPQRNNFPDNFEPTAPRVFARWPVDITAIDIPPDANWDEHVAIVKQRFTLPESFFTAKWDYAKVGGPPWPMWWHSAHYYDWCLRTIRYHLPDVSDSLHRLLDNARREYARDHKAGALTARGVPPNIHADILTRSEKAVTTWQTKIVEFERLAPQFERFVLEFGEWIRGTDPWQTMSPEALETLASFFDRGKTVFESLTRNYTPMSLDDLQTETILALATADDAAYATLPEVVRRIINTEYLMPTSYWHQMFGRGKEIMRPPDEHPNEGNVLLLQLSYDKMMHWKFGDMNAYQFWISPEDLVRENWAAARLVFEVP